MKAIMMTVRLWWFYLTYKGIKKAEIRKIFSKNFKGKIFECVSKTNWKKDLMKIPEEEREFFKQFVGKVGLCFECDKVETICKPSYNINLPYYVNEENVCKKSCLHFIELRRYLKGKNGYAIHINKLEIFDEPKEIGEFYKVGYYKAAEEYYYDNLDDGYDKSRAWTKAERSVHRDFALTCAPQSYCYIEV